jgi:hypothetical protein
MAKVIMSSLVLGSLMTLTIVMSKNHMYIATVTGILYVVGIIRVITTMKK